MERRHQKEIESLESQSEEAPRVIKALRDELSHVKSKVKIYFAQIGEDSRQIRQIDEERRRLREYNAKLEKLVQEKNLADRDTLNVSLQEAHAKILDLENQVAVIRCFHVVRMPIEKLNLLKRTSALIISNCEASCIHWREKTR